RGRHSQDSPRVGGVEPRAGAGADERRGVGVADLGCLEADRGRGEETGTRRGRWHLMHSEEYDEEIPSLRELMRRVGLVYEDPSVRFLRALWTFHRDRIDYLIRRKPEEAELPWDDDFPAMFNQLLLWTREVVYHVDPAAWPEYIGGDYPCPPYPPGR